MANTIIGTISLVATVDTSQYERGTEKVKRANRDMEGSADTTSRKSNSAFSSIAKVGMAAAAAGAVALGALIVKNIGGAIKRVDTLNNSTRTFANMGFDAKVSKSAIDNLTKSILGLPTSLDSAVRGTTALAASYQDINRGQKVFSALNDAILGFGGSADMVDNAVMQLSQLPMDGPLDAQTWNSLRNSGITPVLVAMAKQSGMSVSEMKKAFGEGQLTVEDFTNKLIELDTQGGGGLKSLQKIAKDSTSGIGTGWANLNTAITRGLADIIKTIGSEKISSGITNIGKAFEVALGGIAAFFEFLSKHQSAMAAFTGAVIGLGIAIGVALAPAIWGLVVAFGALILAALPFILIGAAIGLIAFAIIKNWDTLKSWLTAFWDWIKTAASTVFDWFKKNWPLLLAIISGPIGLAVLAVVKNFDKIKVAVQKVWNWIKGAFGKIADIGTSAIKVAVNSVLGFAERTINGFIRLVNKAIHAINRLPGPDIGNIGEIKIPRLAKGGIIPATPGGRMVIAGEAGQDEAVIPLDELDQRLRNERGGNGGKSVKIEQYNTVNNNVDMNVVNRRLTWELNRA